MKIETFRNENTITLKLSGYLDFESTPPLCKDLQKILPDAKDKQIIFDFAALQFVGSSGVTIFLQVLRDFNLKTEKAPFYFNVKSEFKKLASALDASKTFIFQTADGETDAANTDLDAEFLHNPVETLQNPHVLKMD